MRSVGTLPGSMQRWPRLGLSNPVAPGPGATWRSQWQAAQAGTPFPAHQRLLLPLIVLVEAVQRGVDAKVGKQLAGVPRVLCQHLQHGAEAGRAAGGEAGGKRCSGRLPSRSPALLMKQKAVRLPTMVAERSTRSARSVMSSRLPIGVETMYRPASSGGSPTAAGATAAPATGAADMGLEPAAGAGTSDQLKLLLKSELLSPSLLPFPIWVAAANRRCRLLLLLLALLLAPLLPPPAAAIPPCQPRCPLHAWSCLDQCCACGLNVRKLMSCWARQRAKRARDVVIFI